MRRDLRASPRSSASAAIASSHGAPDLRVSRRSSRRRVDGRRRLSRPSAISPGAPSSRSTGPPPRLRGRGAPDRAKTLGDPGPRVWETFKSARGDCSRSAPTAAASRPRRGRATAAPILAAASTIGEKTIASFSAVRGIQPAELRRRRAGQSARCAERRIRALRGPLQRAGVRRLSPTNGWSEGRNLARCRASARISRSARSRSRRRGGR